MMSSNVLGRILSARGLRSFRLCLGGVERLVPLTGTTFNGVPDGEATALIGDGRDSGLDVDEVSTLGANREVVLTFLSSLDAALWS